MAFFDFFRRKRKLSEVIKIADRRVWGSWPEAHDFEIVQHWLHVHCPYAFVYGTVVSTPGGPVLASAGPETAAVQNWIERATEGTYCHWNSPFDHGGEVFLADEEEALAFSLLFGIEPQPRAADQAVRSGRYLAKYTRL